MANFYLICGFYGSGKTTLAKELSKTNNIKLIDVDKRYEDINGDECIRNNSFDVWMSLYKEIHESELSNNDIIFCTSSLQERQRQEFLEWFHNFNFHLIWVMSPWDICLENNYKRTRKIPLEKLTRDWQLIEIPNPNENGWNTITHIYNFNNNEKYDILKLKGNIKTFITL